jgi:hypothetical protein
VLQKGAVPELCKMHEEEEERKRKEKVTFNVKIV